MATRNVFVAWSVFTVLSCGCSERPKAPPLTNEAIYQNEKVGIRFLAPSGWSISSRADMPSGKLAKPIILVGYLQTSGEKPAEFELVAADVPDGADPGQFLADHRIGPSKWTVKPGAASTQVGGIPATRYDMTAGTGKNEYQREATAVRRGDRVFYFVVTYGMRDGEHRDHAHRCVESVTWTK
jgi:hypothetical protein